MDNMNKIMSELRIKGFDVTFYKEKCILRRYTGKETEVIIPDIVDEIGDYAFYDNKKVKRITFGENIKTIATSAFEDCSSLEYISPLTDVTTIGPYAFSYTIRLSHIDLGGKLTEISEYAFCGSGLEDIFLPESIKRVAFKAFFACPKLESVSLKGDDAVYEESVFANCMRLKSLNASSGVREFGRRAFSYCKVLESVIISENTILGEDAFEAVPAEIQMK